MTKSSTAMFTAASFTRAKKRQKLKCPLTDENINKMWRIHPMEHHSVLKREEILHLLPRG